MAKAESEVSMSALVAAFFKAEQAAQRFEAALAAVMNRPALSVADLLAKLKMADRFDDITEQANEPGQKLVAVRVIASAIADAERLAKKGGVA
jgi:hypothetical protein